MDKVLSDIGLHLQLIREQILGRLSKQYPDLKLSFNQNLMVYLLAQNPNISSQEIAKKMHISKSAATQLTQSMINRGLIQKTVRPDDKRSVVLQFTDKAVHYNRIVIEETTKQIAIALKQDLTDEDMKSLLRIRDHLREYNKKIRESN